MQKRFLKLLRQKSIKDFSDRNEPYNFQTFLVTKRVLRKDSNCIDVGCHTGEILTWILKLCPKGVHFAFEPIPDLYRYLI